MWCSSTGSIWKPAVRWLCKHDSMEFPSCSTLEVGRRGWSDCSTMWTSQSAPRSFTYPQEAMQRAAWHTWLTRVSATGQSPVVSAPSSIIHRMRLVRSPLKPWRWLILWVRGMCCTVRSATIMQRTVSSSQHYFMLHKWLHCPVRHLERDSGYRKELPP